LPHSDRSPNFFDNFLLVGAEGGCSNMLVSGDKRGVLELKSLGVCRIVTVRTGVCE
jgi:hypothetical protein